MIAKNTCEWFLLKPQVQKHRLKETAFYFYLIIVLRERNQAPFELFS